MSGFTGINKSSFTGINKSKSNVPGTSELKSSRPQQGDYKRNRDISDTASECTVSSRHTLDLYPDSNQTLTKEEFILCKLWCANVVIRLLLTDTKRELLSTIGNPTCKDIFGNNLKPNELGKNRKLLDCLSNNIDPRLSIDRSDPQPYVFLSEPTPSRSTSLTSKDSSSVLDSPGKEKSTVSSAMNLLDMSISAVDSSQSNSLKSVNAIPQEALVIKTQKLTSSVEPEADVETETEVNLQSKSSVWLTPLEWRQRKLLDMGGKPYTLIAPLELKNKDYIRRVNDLLRDGICHLVEQLILQRQSDSGSAAARKVTNLTTALTFLKDHPLVLGTDQPLDEGKLSDLEQGCFSLVENKFVAKPTRPHPKLFKAAETVLSAFAPMSKMYLHMGIDSVQKAQNEMKLLVDQFNFHTEYNRQRENELSMDPVILNFALRDVIPQREPDLVLRNEVYSLTNMIKAAANEAVDMSTFKLPAEFSLPSGEFDANPKTILLPKELRADPFLPGMLMAEALRIQSMSLDEVAEDVKLLFLKPTKIRDSAEILARCMVKGRVLERVVIRADENNDDAITFDFHYAGDIKEFSKETQEEQQDFVYSVCMCLEEVTGIPMSLQLINPDRTSLRGIMVCEGSINVIFCLNITAYGWDKINQWADMFGTKIPPAVKEKVGKICNKVDDFQKVSGFLSLLFGIDVDSYVNKGATYLFGWVENHSGCCLMILLLFIIYRIKARTSRMHA